MNATLGVLKTDFLNCSMRKIYFLPIFIFISLSCTKDEQSIIDTDIENYIVIGSQIWSLNNLDVSTYTDGTIIPQIDAGNESTEWRELKTGAWTYAKNCNCGADYTFSDSELHSFGKLYNWYAVMGIHDEDPNTPNKKLSPEGWKIPSMKDFELLFENNDSQSLRATGIKNDETGLWFYRDGYTIATNSSGFTALPAGFKNASGFGNNNGGYGNTGYYAYFWTSDVGNAVNAGVSIISSLQKPKDLSLYYWDKNNGFSVRLIKED